MKISKNGHTTCKNLNLPPKKINKLKKNIFLIHTKKQRSAGEILKKQSEQLLKDNKKIELMYQIQKLPTKQEKYYLVKILTCWVQFK